MSNGFDEHDGDEVEGWSPDPAWCPESSAPDLSPDDPDAWRGNVHPAEWPEWDAGPEYLMWKRIADDEGE